MLASRRINPPRLTARASSGTVRQALNGTDPIKVNIPSHVRDKTALVAIVPDKSCSRSNMHLEEHVDIFSPADAAILRASQANGTGVRTESCARIPDGIDEGVAVSGVSLVDVAAGNSVAAAAFVLLAWLGRSLCGLEARSKNEVG
jgi:hypothetical protein